MARSRKGRPPSFREIDEAERAGRDTIRGWSLREVNEEWLAMGREILRKWPIIKARALHRAFSDPERQGLTQELLDRYRRKTLHLNGRTASRQHYAVSLLRVFKRMRWASIDDPDGLMRYLRKSVHWEAIEERRKAEMWQPRRRTVTATVGRPGRIPGWITSDAFRALRESDRLTESQRAVADLLARGVSPAEALRRTGTRWSAYTALHHKVVGRRARQHKKPR